MGFLPILLPFLEAVTGKRINPGGPKRPFQKTDEFGGQSPQKKTDKCAPKPDFPGRPPCVYSGVLAAFAGCACAVHSTGSSRQYHPRQRSRIAVDVMLNLQLEFQETLWRKARVESRSGSAFYLSNGDCAY